MLLKIANETNIIVKVSKNMSGRRVEMGKARTKEECRRQIIKQAKNWLRKKRTIYVIGQRQNDVDYIYSLLENSSLKHCKFLRGGLPARFGYGADYAAAGIYFRHIIC